MMETPTEIYKRKFNTSTIQSFCNVIKSTSWQSVTSEKSPKDAFNNFFEKINLAVETNFPLIKVKPKPKKFKHSAWMTAGLLISCKKKEKLFAKKKRCPSPQNANIFKTYNTFYNKIRRAAYNEWARTY